MFSKFIVHGYIYILTFTNYMGFSPFRYNWKLEKLQVHFLSHFRTITSFSWGFAYATIVLPTHLYQLYLTRQRSKFNFTFVCLIGCYTASLVLGILSFRAQGCCQLLNALLKVIPEFSKKYNFRLTDRENVVVASLLLAVFFGPVGVGCMVALDCIIRPYGGPYLLFNIDPRVVTWPIHLWASFWFGRWAIGFMSAFSSCIGGGLFYVAFALPLLRNELRMGRRAYRSNETLRRNVHNLVTSWKILEIFVKIVNMEITFALLYLEAILGSITLFCTVTLVHQWSTTGLITRLTMTVAAAGGITVWSIALILCGLVYKWGDETLGTWRKEYWSMSKDWNYMKRVKLSCKPFSFGDGKRYFIQPISILNFLSSVSRNTFRSLITYEDFVDRLTNVKGFRRK